MSRVVFQGLQSCLDPHLHESTTLRLKLISPPTIAKNRGSSVLENQTLEIRDKCHKEEVKSTHIDKGCWNFIPTNYPQVYHTSIAIDTPYVHPSSFSKLSDKSLQLCTENLGSETGSETMGSSIFSLELDNQESFVKERNSSIVSVELGNQESFVKERNSSIVSVELGNQESFVKERNSSIVSLELGNQESYVKERKSTCASANIATRKENPRNFPPPLTSISGSNHVLVRSHGEGGRLIIKAIESTQSRTCFQVERSQGRVQMRFVNPKFDQYDHGNDGEDHEIVGVENGGECYEENQEDSEVEDEEECNGYLREDMDGNSYEVEGKIGMGKFQRASRCKERRHGNKGVCKWEAFCVATS